MTIFKSYVRLFLLLTGFHLLAIVLAFIGTTLCLIHEIGPEPIGKIFAFSFWALTFPTIDILAERMHFGLAVVPLNSLVFGIMVSAIVTVIRFLKKTSNAMHATSESAAGSSAHDG